MEITMEAQNNVISINEAVIAILLTILISLSLLFVSHITSKVGATDTVSVSNVTWQSDTSSWKGNW